MASISQDRSGRVFDNKLLEILSRTSPTIIWTAYIPLLCSLIFVDVYFFGRTAWQVAALFLGAVLSWSLAEYILHRYVFHFINDNSWVQKFHNYTHGYHHAHPRDKAHLFMPVPLGFLAAGIFLGLFYLLMGSVAFSFLPGFLVGYLIYATVHYQMHIHPQAPYKFLRSLWRHHHLHHFKHHDAAFGVSSTLWDHVFRTMPLGKSNP